MILNEKLNGLYESNNNVKIFIETYFDNILLL